jgi:hypothetical protein
METAEHPDQSVLHSIDFRYREVIRHLLGETPQQVTVANNRLLEGVHYLGPDQVLGWNHVVQVKRERLLENVPLRLPILLGNRDEFIVGSELLGRLAWHGPLPFHCSTLFYLLDKIYQDTY